MLSGRYVTDHRARFWSKSNPEGYCQLCQATGHELAIGSLEHLLLKCPVLSENRSQSISHWSLNMVDKPDLLPLVTNHTLPTDVQGELLHLQFLLDPSVCPKVISAVQEVGVGILSHLHYMTRTWCHSQHLKRKRILKFYNVL